MSQKKISAGLNGGNGKLVVLERCTQAISMLSVLMLVVLLIQLWLITIALEAYMSRNSAVAVPTFLGSGFCLALNLWLLN